MMIPSSQPSPDYREGPPERKFGTILCANTPAGLQSSSTDKAFRTLATPIIAASSTSAVAETPPTSSSSYCISFGAGPIGLTLHQAVVSGHDIACMVTSVQQDGAAARQTTHPIKVGDHITHVNGQVVTSHEQTLEWLKENQNQTRRIQFVTGNIVKVTASSNADSKAHPTRLFMTKKKQQHPASSPPSTLTPSGCGSTNSNSSIKATPPLPLVVLPPLSVNPKVGQGEMPSQTSSTVSPSPPHPDCKQLDDRGEMNAAMATTKMTVEKEQCSQLSRNLLQVIESSSKEEESRMGTIASLLFQWFQLAIASRISTGDGTKDAVIAVDDSLAEPPINAEEQAQCSRLSRNLLQVIESSSKGEESRVGTIEPLLVELNDYELIQLMEHIVLELKSRFAQSLKRNA